MKVLSLSQPWASLVVTRYPADLLTVGIKGWETRGWEPSKDNLDQIRAEGLLIHASKTWRPNQRELMNTKPFVKHKKFVGDMPFGCIIGWVTVGEIISTDEWVMRESFVMKDITNNDEYHYGNYSTGRKAWELTECLKFSQPIAAKGKLSLWDYDLPEWYLREIGQRKQWHEYTS